MEEHSYSVLSSYGSAGGSKRVQPDSVFRIASISKPITAFAILHLCVQNNLSLDAKVFGKKGILKAYKYKDQRVSAITVRHLLQHSAGWDRDIAGDAAFQRPAVVARCHPESVDHNGTLVAYTLKKRLQFKPGSRHAYSNLCYLILGLVLEEVSGLPFQAYLSRVLDRWGVHGICLGSPWRASWDSNEVEYFNNREPEIVPSLHADFGELLPQYGGMALGSAGPYGGLTANSSSLLNFVHTIENILSGNPLDGHLDSVRLKDNVKEENGVDLIKLSNLVKESFWRPSYELGKDWYGLGWDVEDSGQSWGHTGGMEGTSCILFHHTSGLDWVLLLNAWAKDIDLNGVMKCAVSRVPSLTLFDCDVCGVMDVGNQFHGCGEYETCKDENKIGQILFTKDKSQAVVLGVSETQAYSVTASLKKERYVITWVNTVQHGLGRCLSPYDGAGNSKMLHDKLFE